jgi:16S rRNA (cytidine1402-2'-O)-methyltransferase
LLQHCDAIAAEDTRHTSTLLNALGISKPLLACHEHNEQQAATKIIERLQAQQRVAYVSDAGTPGVSDPGARLVQAVREAGLGVVPVPGVSAVTTALSVSGLVCQGFHFAGFLPSKAEARRHSLQALADLSVPLVFYEAPHRIKATVTAMQEMWGGERNIIIARELTKRFEEIHRCRLSQALAWLEATPEHSKGEFVLVVEGKNKDTEHISAADKVLKPLLAALPTKQAVQLAAEITGLGRNALYERALSLKD